jgi:small subunit ribosomal protein S20
LANTAQARKRARQAVRNRAHNFSMRSRMRTAVKQVTNAIAAGDKDQAKEAYQKAVPLIDSTARKGMIHKNKAARHKSRLNKQLLSM